MSPQDCKSAELVASLSGYAISPLKLNEIGTSPTRKKPITAQQIMSARILAKFMTPIKTPNDTSDRKYQITVMSLYFLYLFEAHKVTFQINHII